MLMTTSGDFPDECAVKPIMSGKQHSGGLAAREGKRSMNADKLVDNFWREEASEVCALPLNFLDALVCRNVPEHKDSGNQDRN
jgi:hypothetical protein